VATGQIELDPARSTHGLILNLQGSHANLQQL